MAGRVENLRPPIQPGEVRNPKGINQYTYRGDAEATFDRLLRSVAERGEETVAEAILEDLCVMAQERNTWAIDRVLERILPKVDRHELDVSGSDTAGLVDALADAARRRRSNGDGREPHAGSNGGGE